MRLVILFKSAIAYREGLALENVVDKDGRMTRRWKRRTRDRRAPAGRPVPDPDAAADRFETAIASKTEPDKQAFRAAKRDGVAIPPAWTGVVYHGRETPKNGIIATGKDAKGRAQRLEDPAFRAAQVKAKHERIAKNLAPRMPGIVRSLVEMAPRDDAAKVLYLITQTGFRIGGPGDGKADADAYGASTLLGRHVRVDGGIVHFDFPGKIGVRQEHSIDDRRQVA